MSNNLNTISFPQLIMFKDQVKYTHNIFGTLAGIGDRMNTFVTSIGIIADLVDTCKMITCAGDTMTSQPGYSVPWPHDPYTKSNKVSYHDNANTYIVEAGQDLDFSGTQNIIIASPRARRRNFLCNNTERNYPHNNAKETMLLSGWYKRELTNEEDIGPLPLIDNDKWKEFKLVINNIKQKKADIKIIDNNILLERRLINIRQSTLVLSLNQLEILKLVKTRHHHGIPEELHALKRIDGVYILHPSIPNGQWTVIHAWKERCSVEEAHKMTCAMQNININDEAYYGNIHKYRIHIGQLAANGAMIFDNTTIVKVNEDQINNTVIKMLNIADASLDTGSINDKPKLLSLTASMPPLISPIAKGMKSPVKLSIINPTKKKASNDMLKMYIANAGASTSNLDTRDECISRFTEVSNNHPLDKITGKNLPAILIDLSSKMKRAEDNIATSANINALMSVLARTSYGIVSLNDRGAMQNLKDLSKIGHDGKHKDIPAFAMFTIDSILNEVKPGTFTNIDRALAAINKPLSGSMFVVFGRYKGVNGFVSQAQLKGSIVKSAGIVFKRHDKIEKLTDPAINEDINQCVEGRESQEYDIIYTLDDLHNDTLQHEEIEVHNNLYNNFKGFIIIAVNDEKLATSINAYTKRVNEKIAQKYADSKQLKYNANVKELPDIRPITEGLDMMYHCIAAMTPDTITEISNGTKNIEDVLPSVKAPKGFNYENYATVLMPYRLTDPINWNQTINENKVAIRKNIVAGLRYVFST